VNHLHVLLPVAETSNQWIACVRRENGVNENEDMSRCVLELKPISAHVQGCFAPYALNHPK